MLNLKLSRKDATELYDVLEEALGDISSQPMIEEIDRASIDARLAFVEKVMDRLVLALSKERN